MDKFLTEKIIRGGSFGLKSELAFLRSALTTENPFNSISEILEWLKACNEVVSVQIDRIRLDEMADWIVDKNVGIRHKTGGFFSIEGIRVNTNWGLVPAWDQPVIKQTEIGFLGIITKEFNGILYFMMQAKTEPGNINNVQLSPTLQATKSNYSAIHRGRRPKYLEYFQEDNKNIILLDQLQSEQGARFLKKRNRNMIIKVLDDIDLDDHFRWMTLAQIKELMSIDNVVNMDTRTVISGISFGNHRPAAVDFYNIMNTDKHNIFDKFLISEINADLHYFSFDYIIHWFTALKTKFELKIENIPLAEVSYWQFDDYSLRHDQNKYFNVIGVNVQISNREVSNWQQPIIEPVQEGICAFISREILGIVHFLVQAKVEAGNFDILEMAPTVQCLTGNYLNDDSRKNLPYLDYVLTANESNIVFDAYQSEEGGRFYKEQNRNMIILVDDEFPLETPFNYIWMTLNQLKSFIKFNNYLNSQARSLIAAVSLHAKVDELGSIVLCK